MTGVRVLKIVTNLRGYLLSNRYSPELQSEKGKIAGSLRYAAYITRWKAGEESGMRGTTAISAHIRKYLFIKYGNKCCDCGWNRVNLSTGRIPLEVEHIDGDHKNNSEENLKLICPNCHSLTSTYRSLNMGKGRPRKA